MPNRILIVPNTRFSFLIRTPTPIVEKKRLPEQIHVVADRAQIGEYVHRETEFVNLPRRENDGFRGSDQAMTAVDILSQSAQARLVDEADALAEPVEPVPASGVIEIQELPGPCSALFPADWRNS